MQSSTHPHNLIHLHRNRGYRFTDRDPILDEICNLLDKSKMTLTEIANQTEKSFGSRISPQTINKWLDGTTKKPQNYTITCVAWVLGYERKFRKI